MVREVYPTDEIPHLWVHSKVTSARNGGRNNLFCDDDTIYSYGRHFPIARHVTRRGKGKAILFTTRSYSVTTARHVRLVRRAIPSDVRLIYCADVRPDSHADNLRDYEYQIALATERLATARDKAPATDSLNHKLTLARDYCSYFGLRRKWRAPTKKELQVIREKKKVESAAKAQQTREDKKLAVKEFISFQASYAEKIREWLDGKLSREPSREVWLRGRHLALAVPEELAAEVQVRREKYKAAERRERMKSAFEWLNDDSCTRCKYTESDFPEKLNALILAKQARLDENTLAAWRLGDRVASPRSGTYLRLVGEEVQSNHGARVPLAHALRFYRALQSGEVPNAVGGYSPVSVNGDIVTIGCHYIPRSEFDLVYAEVQRASHTH